MKVLVACEFSGIVRDAFIARGHDAVSCDLLPSERPGPHIQGDVKDIDLTVFDLLIAHPPCTRLSRSSAQWIVKRNLYHERDEALNFVLWLMAAPVERIAIENPIGAISTYIRKPDQTIQPWQYGHGEVKATCLWLKNLPLLQPTCIVDGRAPRCWKTGETKNRWKLRSRTYPGIAQAMALQWTCV